MIEIPMKDGTTMQIRSLKEANQDFIKRIKEKRQRTELAKEMLNPSEETSK